MTKTAYLFNEKTKEFLYPTEVHECPVIKGNFYLPETATWIAPPEKKEKTVYLFLETNWQETPDLRGDIWYYKDSGLPFEITTIGTPPEVLVKDIPPSIVAEQEKQKILATRGQLLSASDWTQMPDSPFTKAKKEAWAVYRQALRDVTSQSGFPTSITWPVAPV